MGGAIDFTSSKDIPYELMAGAINENKPDVYILNDDYFLDQSLTKDTWYACVAFSTTSSINEIYHKRLHPNRYNPEYLTNKMVELGRLDRNVGAYVVDGPKTAQELDMIDGYAIVKTIDEIKDSLLKDRPVVTGSARIDWKKTKDVVVEGNSYGHAFFICGYDEKKKSLICENSYGEKNGRFYLKYVDIGLLFNSKYSVFIDDYNFTQFKRLYALSKAHTSMKFYKNYIEGKEGKEKGLAMLASQMRYLGKINSKELIDLFVDKKI